MLTMTVTEARARMREALEHVKEGQEVELSQNGQVIAVIVHPSKLHSRVRTTNTIAAGVLLENLKRAKSQNAGTGRRTINPVLSAERGADLEQDVRQQRDGPFVEAAE
jgi:prevent-host-death family protein